MQCCPKELCEDVAGAALNLFHALIPLQAVVIKPEQVVVISRETLLFDEKEKPELLISHLRRHNCFKKFRYYLLTCSSIVSSWV